MTIFQKIVKAGDLLFRIDPELYRIAAAQAVVRRTGGSWALRRARRGKAAAFQAP